MKRAGFFIALLLGAAAVGGCNSISGLFDLKFEDSDSVPPADDPIIHPTFGVSSGGGVVYSEKHRARVLIGGMPMQAVNSEQHRAKIGLGAQLHQ